jgi:hypothetical protein
MALGATLGIWDLTINASTDLEAIRGRLPAVTPELEGVLTKAGVHLRQGEEIFAKHRDAARRERHLARLRQAYSRTAHLLARLLTVNAEADHPVLRKHTIRREHRLIEVDALGAEKVSEAEQARETRRLLEWTEDDMGEQLTDANKAQLAQRIADLAKVTQLGEDAAGQSWFFDME